MVRGNSRESKAKIMSEIPVWKTKANLNVFQQIWRRSGKAVPFVIDCNTFVSQFNNKKKTIYSCIRLLNVM